MNRSYDDSILLADPAFGRLKEHVIESTGLAYYLGKETDLARKFQTRMGALGLSTWEAYLDRLECGSEGEIELDELIGDLTIGETFFFRHQEQFDALRDLVLPEIIERNKASRRLRIWCAGCAIGAEPYSLAILLDRDFGVQLAGWDVTLIATDINRRFLASAREGQFSEWALRSSPEEFRREYFREEGSNWVIREKFRRAVSFQYHNLVRHPFPSLANNLVAFDVVSCRNVMMYFDRDVMGRLIGQFRSSLVDEGWMMVGPSESDVELFRGMEVYNLPSATLYRNSLRSLENAAPFADFFTPADVASPTPKVRQQPPAESPRMEPHPVPLPSPFPATSAPRPESEIRRDELDDLIAMADRGEWTEALDRCRGLLSADAIRAPLHFFHALLLENMGDRNGSEEALRKTIYLDRNDALAHYHLGLLLRKRGDDVGAAKAFRNTTRLVQNLNPEAILRLGDGISPADLSELAGSELNILEV